MQLFVLFLAESLSLLTALCLSFSTCKVGVKGTHILAKLLGGSELINARLLRPGPSPVGVWAWRGRRATQGWAQGLCDQGTQGPRGLPAPPNCEAWARDSAPPVLGLRPAQGGPHSLPWWTREGYTGHRG